MHSMVESGPILKVSETINMYLSLLPARMKKFQSRMKALECLKAIGHFLQTLKGS